MKRSSRRSGLGDILRPGIMAGMAALCWSGSVMAQYDEEVVAPDTDRPAGPAAEETLTAEVDKVSASVGIDFSSHFVSYGSDVWGGGDDFYGDERTRFIWGEVGIALTDVVSFTFGAWSDVNNNGDDSVGGDIQEIDVYGGLGFDVQDFSFGVTYQEWYYSSETERILDLSAAFDDAGLWQGGFALNPAVIWHIRLEGNGAQEEGSAVVASITPGFDLNASARYPLTLSIPIGVAFFLNDDFQGGDDGGYAYSFAGATLGVPLGFIPAAYGEWSLAASLLYYLTEEDAIPNNPEENFLTGQIGLALSF